MSQRFSGHMVASGSQDAYRSSWNSQNNSGAGTGAWIHGNDPQVMKSDPPAMKKVGRPRLEEWQKAPRKPKKVVKPEWPGIDPETGFTYGFDLNKKGRPVTFANQPDWVIEKEKNARKERIAERQREWIAKARNHPEYAAKYAEQRKQARDGAKKRMAFSKMMAKKDGPAPIQGRSSSNKSKGSNKGEKSVHDEANRNDNNNNWNDSKYDTRQSSQWRGQSQMDVRHSFGTAW